jgi:hypothetical protein
MASYEFGELTINLTGLGGKGEDAGKTAASIADRVTTTLGVEKSIVATELFVHLPSKDRKTIAFVDGAKDYDEQVRRVVSGELRGKDAQIGRSTCKDAVGIIALDCRSLFPALPPPDKQGLVASGWLDYYEPRIKRWTKLVIGESQSFLATATNARGVLIWFRHQARGLVSKLSEYLQFRDTICLVSDDAVTELSANTFAELLEKALIGQQHVNNS